MHPNVKVLIEREYAAQKSQEWGQELWLAALDVEKAFDRVHHAHLWKALEDTLFVLSHQATRPGCNGCTFDAY